MVHDMVPDMVPDMVHGAWCMVHGAWCMGHDAWCMVHGAWRRGGWCIHHIHPMKYGPILKFT